MCCSPVSLQNWWSGAWYDLWYVSVGVAWRSPPISVITAGNLDVISVIIHVRISVYIVSFALVWSYGIYADIAMRGEPSYGVSVSAEM